MISKITGQLTSLSDDTATLAIDAFEYVVRVPEYTRRQIQGHKGEEISLHTIQYLEGNPAKGRLIPRLIGFATEVEREFFELFCSVDGVGVKTALRAMVRPVAEVARLIESQDAKGLSTLPGIGPASSERIVAKLRRRMAKFALVVSQGVDGADIEPDLVEETFNVLRSLGHSEGDARRLLDSAFATGKKFKDFESVINEVYRQSK